MFKYLFTALLLIVVHMTAIAQDQQQNERNCILGLWEIRPGIQYFFHSDGSGDLFLGQDSESSAQFTYRIDSTSQSLYRVHLQFMDSITPEACFVYEPGDKNQLHVYMLHDPRNCPDKINSPEIIQAIWTRPSYEGN